MGAAEVWLRRDRHRADQRYRDGGNRNMKLFKRIAQLFARDFPKPDKTIMTLEEITAWWKALPSKWQRQCEIIVYRVRKQGPDFDKAHNVARSKTLCSVNVDADHPRRAPKTGRAWRDRRPLHYPYSPKVGGFTRNGEEGRDSVLPTSL